jgi:hypothetical protein
MELNTHTTSQRGALAIDTEINHNYLRVNSENQQETSMISKRTSRHRHCCGSIQK